MSSPSKNLRSASITLPDIRKSWLLLSIVLVGAILLGLGAWTIVATGQGANFDTVFNEPARTADASTEITWLDGEPLLRALEPQTIDGVELAWTRAFIALGNAAVDGDTTGVDTWFSGPAREQVLELLATGAVDGGPLWTSHEITPQFYSIDGQILVTTIQRTSAGIGEQTDVADEARAVFVLRDGNWRIEHLVRTGNAS